MKLTRTVEKIAALTTPAVGTVSCGNLAAPGAAEIQLDAFPVSTKYQAEKEPRAALYPDARPAQHQTTLTFLIDHCDTWMVYETSLPYYSPRTKPLWTALKVIIHSLHNRGWLGTSFHLAHNDLFPRNIFAEIISPTSVRITGIVDRDMATLASLASLAVNFRAPFWAWKGAVAAEQDEDVARAPAVGEERMALKKAFLEAASSQYQAFGLSAEAVFARKVWRLVSEGLGSEVVKSVAREVVDSSGEMYPEDDVVETWMDAMAKVEFKSEDEWNN